MADLEPKPVPPLPHAPRRSSTEELERVTVGRERLLARLEELVLASSDGGGRHFRVVVGPRGSGKTHVLAVLRARLARRRGLDRRLAVAWLDEAPWRVPTVAHLFREIARELATGDEELAARVVALEEVPRSDQTEAARRLAIEAIGDRVLLLMIENLDDVLDQIGNAGQKTLRAFLQQDARCCVVASSRTLNPALVSRDEPFHGFFGVDALEPLSPEEIADLLARLARARGDAALARRFDSARALARVRALDRLLGGNARRWVLLSRHLDARALEDPTAAMRATVDDLLPHLEDRMTTISPQQRLLVAALGDEGGAVPVKALARRCLVTEQSASAQLRDLKAARFVVDTRVGRETFYEVADPLVRFALRARREGGGELEATVALLCAWHDDARRRAACKELKALLARAPAEWPGGSADLGEDPAALAAGLIATARELGDDMLSDAAREAWAELWRTRAADEASLALAVRAVDAAVARARGDGARAVMSVTSVVRELLEESYQE